MVSSDEGFGRGYPLFFATGYRPPARVSGPVARSATRCNCLMGAARRSEQLPMATVRIARKNRTLSKKTIAKKYWDAISYACYDPTAKLNPVP